MYNEETSSVVRRVAITWSSCLIENVMIDVDRPTNRTVPHSSVPASGLSARLER